MTTTAQHTQATTRPDISARDVAELGAALAYFRQHFAGWAVWCDAAGEWTATRPVWLGEARHVAPNPVALEWALLHSSPTIVPRPRADDAPPAPQPPATVRRPPPRQPAPLGQMPVQPVVAVAREAGRADVPQPPPTPPPPPHPDPQAPAGGWQQPAPGQ